MLVLHLRRDNVDTQYFQCAMQEMDPETRLKLS